MSPIHPRRLAPLVPGALLALLLAPPSMAAGLIDGYAAPDRVAGDLRALAGRLPGGTIMEYGRTVEGRPLLALQVFRGTGDPGMKPALLVIGGVEPERLATVELALAIAGRAGAVPDSGVDPLLTSVLYVIPDAAPDGRARVLAGGSGWIGAPVDDDADDRLDEDGVDDLDGDGLVRWMRVWKSGGAYRADTSDVRASRKVDAASDQPGQFDLVREGKDNDGDDRIGEDAPGGTRLDANFPGGWVLFGPGASHFPMAHPESKALADFVLARPNIAMALVLGNEEILSGEGGAAGAGGGSAGGKGKGGRGAGAGGPGGAGGAGGGGGGSGAGGGGGTSPGGSQDSDDDTPRGAPIGGPQGAAGADLLAKESTSRPMGGFGGGPRKALASIPEADQPYYDRAASAWQKSVGVPKNKAATAGAGSLAAWLRYQIGTFTLASCGWALPDSAQLSSEAGTLKYLRQTNDESAFREWRAFQHPDFPEARVEIGGFDPLLGVVPPRAGVDSLGFKQGDYARELLSWMPRLVVEKPQVTSLGDGLYRVMVDVGNDGWLPTALEAGVTTRRARPVRVEIEAKDGVLVVGGPPVKLISAIAGSGGRERVEWIVKADAGTTIVARAATPRAGEARREVTLR